jgi:hypothetical protein
MLVALAVFGVVAAVLYGTFRSTLESRDHATRRTELFARGRLAVDWLEQDLKGSLSVSTYPAGKPRFLSSGTGDRDSRDLPLLEVTVRTARRTMGTAAESEDSPGASLIDQARVIYRFEELEDDDLPAGGRAPGGERPHGLVRYELRPPLDDDDHDDAALRTVIVRDLESIELRFEDRGAELDRWEPEETTSLRSLGPRIVDVRLTLTDEAGQRAELATAVLVPLGGRGG